MNDNKNIEPLFNRSYGHSTNKPLVNSVMTFDISTNTAGWDDMGNFISTSKFLYNNYYEAKNALSGITDSSVLYREDNYSYSTISILTSDWYSDLTKTAQLDERYKNLLEYDCTNYLGVFRAVGGVPTQTKAINLLPNILDDVLYEKVQNNEKNYLGNKIVEVTIKEDIENTRIFSGTLYDVVNKTIYRLPEPSEIYKRTNESFNIISYENIMAGSKNKIFGGLSAASLHRMPVFLLSSYDKTKNETTTEAYNREGDGTLSKYVGSLSKDYNFVESGEYTSFKPINGSYPERFEYQYENNLIGNKIENGKEVGSLYIGTAMSTVSRSYGKFPNNTTPLSRVFSAHFPDGHYRIRNMALLVKNDITNKKQIYGLKKRDGFDYDYLLAPDVKIDGSHYYACQWGEKTIILGIKTNQYSHFDISCVHSYDPYDSTDGTAWIETTPYTMISNEYGSINGFGGLPFYSPSEPIVVFTMVSSYKGKRINAHIGYEFSRWGMVEGVGEINNSDYNDTYEEMTVTKEGSNYILYVTFSKVSYGEKKTRVEKIIIPETNIVLYKHMHNERFYGSRRIQPASDIENIYHGSITCGNFTNDGEDVGQYQFVRKSYFSPTVDFKRRIKISKLEIPFVINKNSTIPPGLSIFIRDSKNNNLKVCSNYTIESGKIIFDIDYEFKSGRYRLFLMTKNAINTNTNRPFTIMSEYHDRDSNKTLDYIDYGNICVFGNQKYEFNNPSVVPEEGYDFLRFFSVFRLIEPTNAGK